MICNNCGALFRESEAGSKPETWTGEYWGAQFTQTDYYDCCPECGSEEIEDGKYCAECGEPIEPGQEYCENCIEEFERSF
jgi:hypothetical protein